MGTAARKNETLQSLLESSTLWFGRFSHRRMALGATSPDLTTQLPHAKLGLEQIDQALPNSGLEFGAIHEWSVASSITEKSRNHWQPPSLIFALILHNLISEIASGRDLVHRDLAHGQQLVWIGRRCWPTPTVLESAIPEELSLLEQASWKDRCFFIDPANQKHRLWSLLETLRSKAVAATIVDGSKFDALNLRRIKLAAAEGQTLCLLARPPWESNHNSIASTCWRLAALASPNRHPRWSIELLRARGLSAPRSWILEWSNDELSKKSAFHLVSSTDGGGLAKKNERHDSTTLLPRKSATATYRT